MNLNLCRKTRLLLAALGVGVVVVAWVVWPRGPRFEWYTSPPISITKDGTVRARVEMLVPSDWTITSRGEVALVATGHNKAAADPMPLPAISGEPRKTTSPFLSHLKRLIGMADAEKGAYLSLTLSDRREEPHDGDVSLDSAFGQHGEFWTASKSGRSGGTGYWLYYHRNRKEEFNSTYGRICESITVIREP